MLFFILILLLLLFMVAYANAANTDSDDDFLNNHGVSGTDVLFAGWAHFKSRTPSPASESNEYGEASPPQPSQNAILPSHDVEASPDFLSRGPDFFGDDVALAQTGAHLLNQASILESGDLFELDIDFSGLDETTHISSAAVTHASFPNAWQHQPAAIPPISPFHLPSPPQTYCSDSLTRVDDNAGVWSLLHARQLTPSATVSSDPTEASLAGRASRQALHSSFRSRTQPRDRARRVLRDRIRTANHRCREESCSRVFATQSALNHHARCHIPMVGRPHQCPIDYCHWAFISPRELRRHMPSHGIDVTPRVRCPWPQCSRFALGFSLPYNRARHIQGVHGGSWPQDKDGVML